MDDENDDADSHGNDETYGRLRRGNYRRPREDFDLSTTYPMANSHGNAYRESSSHTRYSELYSELAVRNYLEANREDVANYSVANSHGDHSVSSENRERNFRENLENDRLAWDIRQQTDYEVANSHSNYSVFYDSQTQHREFLHTSGWPIESWREHLFDNSRVEEQTQKTENPVNVGNDESARTSCSETKSNSNTEASCDLEQCLVQIEESLLNIEQNLLHVQDLDIPELRNLLYKSPSIEKSLYEVQDLLYADGIVPVINKGQPSSPETEDEDEEEEEEEDEEEEEEVWISHNITVKDHDNEDDDAGAGAFDASNEESSDTANINETNRSGSEEDRSNNDCVNDSTVFHSENTDANCNEKEIDFIPNSLNETLPRRIVLDGANENINLCMSESEEPSVDYNLNSMCIEKKLLYRDKFPSRTNSLDENSTFSNLDSSDKRESSKSSLQDLIFESKNDNTLDLSGKARSEEILQTARIKISKARKKEFNKKRLNIMDEKTADFRKKLEAISSHRRFTMPAGIDQKKPKISKETTTNVPRTREKSPSRTKRSVAAVEKAQDKDKETNIGGGKSSDKRKRKKMSSKSQSSLDNALVPSKLISLSLSLLLAALLQAVRCLTDLVEDAFRSVSYDRSGLLQ